MTTERWQELVLGATALLWGLALILADDLLARVDAYVARMGSFPSWAWGLTLAVCGLTVLGARPLRWRKEAHAGLAILWLLLVALLLLTGVSFSTLLIAAPFVALALLHVHAYLRLSQLAKL